MLQQIDCNERTPNGELLGTHQCMHNYYQCLLKIKVLSVREKNKKMYLLCVALRRSRPAEKYEDISKENKLSSK